MPQQGDVGVILRHDDAFVINPRRNFNKNAATFAGEG